MRVVGARACSDTSPIPFVTYAQDRDGNWFEREGEGIVAQCFCHETEHLDGHLFTELAGRLYTNEELDELMAEEDEA